MAFVQTNANMITQSGTDLNLSTLNGLASVTTTTIGNTTIYTINNSTQVIINGTVSHNTELERIVFQYTTNGQNSVPTIRINGTYNFGTEKGTGTNLYTDGVGWHFGGNDTLWWNGATTTGDVETGCSILLAGGTLNMNGGRIAGSFTLAAIQNGNITNSDQSDPSTWISNSKFLIDSSTQTAGEEYIFRLYESNYDTQDLAIEGGTISLGNGFEGSTISFDRSVGGIGYWPQYDTGSVNPTDTGFTYDPGSRAIVDNVNFNGNAVDVAPRSTDPTSVNILKLRNIGNGTGTNINAGENPGNNADRNSGYTWMTRQVQTDLVRLAGGDAQGVVWVRDTDNGNRTPATAITQFSDAADSTYWLPFNGTLSNTGAIITGGNAIGFQNAENVDNEILIAVHNLVHVDGTQRNTAAADTGIWAWDKRGNSNVAGEDQFTFHVWSYENNYFTTDQSLAGTGVFELGAALQTDPNITLSRADVSAIPAASITYPNTSVDTITVAADLDTTNNTTDGGDIYDVVKYRKETESGQIELPTVSTLIISRSNGTTNYNGLNVTLESATNEFSGNNTNIATLTLNGANIGNGTTSAVTIAGAGNIGGTVSETTTGGNITVVGVTGTLTASRNVRVSNSDLSGVVVAAGNVEAMAGLSGQITATGNAVIDGNCSGMATATGNINVTAATLVAGASLNAGNDLIGLPTTLPADLTLSGDANAPENFNSTDWNGGTVTFDNTITYDFTGDNDLTGVSFAYASGGSAANQNYTLSEGATVTGIPSEWTASASFSINPVIPEGASGLITVRDIDDGSNTNRLIVGGVINPALPNFPSGTNYRVYYKINSSITIDGGRNVGQTYRIRVEDIPDTNTSDFTISPLEVNTFFTQTANSNSDVDVTFAASTGDVITGTFAVRPDEDPVNRANSQAAAILAGNEQAYFNWVVENQLEEDYIDYEPAAVNFNNSVEGVTDTTNYILFQSNDNGDQTIINNWNGFRTNQVGSNDLYVSSGVQQVLNIPVGNADIPTVTTALSGAISNSRLAQDAQELRSNRLLGLKPQTART